MEKKYKKIIISFLMAIITMVAFSVNLREVNLETIDNWVPSGFLISRFIAQWRYIFGGFGLQNSSATVLLAIMYYRICWSDNYILPKKNLIKGLATVFSLCMIIGTSFAVSNSLKLAFGSWFYVSVSVIRFVGFYLFFYYVISWLGHQLIYNSKCFATPRNINRVTYFLFEKHALIGPFLVLIIAWLPYLIACFPGVVQWDSFRQLLNFENLSASDNSHPVFTTILMGVCMKCGRALGSDNLGVFLYILPQFGICALVFSYVIYFTKRLHSPYWLRYCFLGYFAFISLWPLYAVSLFKDTLFYIVFVCYIIFFIQILFEKKYFWQKKGKVICCILSMVLLALIRPNGIHIIVLSFPFLLWAVRKDIKIKLGVFSFASVVAVYMLFNGVIVPALGVSPGRTEEMYCIPFQQTARYVKEYGNEVTKEEKQVISEVLDYDKLAESYNPEFVDPVKSLYVKDASNEDIINYFKVWWQQFLKHPIVYIEATLNGTYGYFYPNKTEYREGLGSYSITEDPQINDGKFNINMMEALQSLREVLDNGAYVVRGIPVIGLLFSNGTYTWLVLLGIVLILQKNRIRNIMPFVPCIMVILFCVASPVNAYIRYMRPVMAASPLLVAWVLYRLNNEDKKVVLINREVNGEKENEDIGDHSCL